MSKRQAERKLKRKAWKKRNRDKRQNQASLERNFLKDKKYSPDCLGGRESKETIISCNSKI